MKKNKVSCCLCVPKQTTRENSPVYPFMSPHVLLSAADQFIFLVLPFFQPFSHHTSRINVKRKLEIQGGNSILFFLNHLFLFCSAVAEKHKKAGTIFEAFRGNIIYGWVFWVISTLVVVSFCGKVLNINEPLLLKSVAPLAAECKAVILKTFIFTAACNFCLKCYYENGKAASPSMGVYKAREKRSPGVRHFVLPKCH